MILSINANKEGSGKSEVGGGEEKRLAIRVQDISLSLSTLFVFENDVIWRCLV